MESYQVAFVGICGSDLQKIRADKNTDPLTLGHELVVHDGDKYAVVNPMISCGECASCRHDRTMLCKNLYAIGRDAAGGFCGTISAPKKNLVPIQFDRVELGVLCDPYAVVVHCLARRKINGRILIIGDGTLAQLALYYLLLKSETIKNITLSAKDATRIAALKKLYSDFPLGASLSFEVGAGQEDSFDLIIEAVGRGQSQALEASVSAVAEGGEIVSLGVYPIGYQAPLTIRKLFYKEAVLSGSNSYTHADLIEAAVDIDANQGLFEKLLGETYSIGELTLAFEAASTGTSIKKKIIVKL